MYADTDQYFSASTHLSAAAWDNSDTLASSGGKISTCGICDNCLRDPASIVTKDATLEAWKCLKVLEEVDRSDGRVTLANLVDLVRGLGGGLFGTVQQKGRKRKSSGEKAGLDLEEIIGGKLDMSKDASLISYHVRNCSPSNRIRRHFSYIYLPWTTCKIVSSSLGSSTFGTLIPVSDFATTACASKQLSIWRTLLTRHPDSVNVYVKPGPKCIRLSRLSQAQVEAGQAVPIECTFPNSKAKSISRKKSAKGSKATTTRLVEISDQEDDDDEAEGQKRDDDVEDGADIMPWDEPIPEAEDDDNDDVMVQESDSESDVGWTVTKGRAGGWRPPNGEAKQSKA